MTFSATQKYRIMLEMKWNNNLKQYPQTGAIAILITATLLVYESYQNTTFNLYNINKILAITAALLLGINLLIGPASRTFRFAGKYLQYRKEIGIIGFFIALLHGVISLLLLPDIFPLSNFFGQINIPFYFGAAATMLLTLLFFISNDTAMNKLGRKIWWQIQFLGVRITFLFIFLHVTVMKLDEWQFWYQYAQTTTPILPPTGLLTGWLLLYIIVIRVLDYFIKKQKKVLWYTGTAILMTIISATFYVAIT